MECTEDEKALNFENIYLHCRTCLGVLANQQYNIRDMSVSLIEILGYACLEMPQIEVFPDSICQLCYDTINQFEKLQKKVLHSTKCLEKLFRHQKTKNPEPDAFLDEENETNGLKQNKPHIRKLEADPLEENEDFESVLVKLEIEVEETTMSGEDETNKDENELISSNPKMEVNIENEKAHTISNTDLIESDSKHESSQILCKYGCGRQFRRTHNAEAHYRFKHKHLEIQNNTINNSDNGNSNKNQSLVGRHSEKADVNLSSICKTTCTVCFKNFATLGGLRSHMSSHCDVRPFQCDQCNRGFNMKARLKRHIREVHQENPPEIPCKYGCGKLFTRHESAMNHYRVKHILPEKGIVPKTNTYICEDCGKTFKTMHNLKEHSYTHKPHTERPFQCEQCQKRFISKRPYEIHLLRHAGIKNFECKICGLKTTTHNELRNHMNHHTKEKQVNCPICSKTYTNPDNLRRHTLIVHQGVKNYKCRFCDEKFGKPDHLKHHEMRHTGERPHKCQVCDRGFIQLVALKAHMKTHNKPTKPTEKVLL